MDNVFGRKIRYRPVIRGVEFSNPVLTASGTCGYGIELEDYYSLEELGGVVLKGTTLESRDGNEVPRIGEFQGGIINSIGLQNPGIEALVSEILPKLKNNTKYILNISGNDITEYVHLTGIADREDIISGIEINISCPNVSKGGLAFGTDPQVVDQLVSECRKATEKPLIVKLTPNVTDIRVIAKAAETGGADAITCINTFRGMLFDLENDDFTLKNIVGGVSGPAIKPMALLAVYECAGAVRIPVIGVGGIMDEYDALEFLKVGATMVQVGTAVMRDPYTPVSIAHRLEYLIGS